MKRKTKAPWTMMLLAFVSFALGATLVAEPIILGNHWIIRIALLAGASGSGAAALFCALASQQKIRDSLSRYLTLLSRSDIHDIANKTPEATCDLSAYQNGWCDVYHQFHQCLLSFSSRIEEIEHARVSADVRSRKLANEHEQMAEILKGLSNPVLAIDHYDELILANESAQKLFHVEVDSQSPEQRSLDQLERFENLFELLSDTRRRKAPVHRSDEISIVDDEGETHWYRVNCRDIATDTDTDSSHGAVAVLSDIGCLKALQKRNAEFVSAVSHEMKTPLAGIKAYVELLIDGDSEDEATREEFLNVIDGQADRLQRLVENLLNLARIEAGVVEVSKKPRSLNDLLEGAAEVVKPSAEQKQIKLTVDLSSMYLGVYADRDMMMQAAINLLSNAIKYTPKGGKVTLRSRLVDDRVIFEIEDTGVGLSEEDAQKVFEKFYRVKKDSEMAAGTGLGLPLAKHIAEDVHGGKLTLKSQLGKGSIFRISLPSVQELSGRTSTSLDASGDVK